MASKVYYMDDRAKAIQDSLVAKMLTVFEAAGLQNTISPGDTVAIKLHMGEYNNTAYLRPVYARALVDKVKELGGEPMVVDTTTLPYTPFASRITALDYLNTAYRNGYQEREIQPAHGRPFEVRPQCPTFLSAALQEKRLRQHDFVQYGLPGERAPYF
ncbi:MAG: DUF362 domain-containing protein [Candidatus Lindowbacteria bacterium]|nr:DUF362 domain-containing protein [Candidatus Lindowbacteria bacterium]